MKTKLKENTAITLIALVVTIVVLLILSAVTINMVIGDNGLITKAQETARKANEIQANSQRYLNELQQDMGEELANANIQIYLDKTQSNVESVTITVEGTVKDDEIIEIECPDGSKIQGNIATYEVNKNGEYIFWIKTKKGKHISRSINVNNIKEEGIDLTNISIGGESNHTHIYEQKYDDIYHWQECFICHNVQSRYAHRLKEEWTYGYESCENGNVCTNYCTDGCGYNKITTKPHEYTIKFTNLTQHKHCLLCENCRNDTTNAERCYKIVNDEKVLISCTENGTCADCGKVYDETQTHEIKWNGDCNLCNNVKGAITTSTTLNYSPDNTSVEVITIVEAKEGVTLPVKWNVGSSFNSITLGPVNVKNITKQKQQLTCTITFKQGYYTPARAYFAGNIILPDGKRGVCTEVGPCGPAYNQPTLYPDRTAPTAKSVTYVGSENVNGFSKRDTITAKFTETFDQVVQMALFDGDTQLTSWENAVKNNTEFTKNFDIISETNSSKTLTVKAKDRCGNLGEAQVEISKLDSQAPIIISDKNYNKEWVKSKKAEIQIEEQGIGEVQVAFNDETKYNLAEQKDGKYVVNYNFVGDVYDEIQCAIYLKDGLGNARTERINIGKIDNTSPTINNVGTRKEGENIIVTINANDINEKIGKEGSGISGYAISTSKELPTDVSYGKSNEIKVEKAGIYYVYVKDNVGNVSARYELNVEEGL